MSSAADSSAARPEVVAIIVSHNGAGWLPTSLAALRASHRPPDRIIGVDTGSVDGSQTLLIEALGEDCVTVLDGTSSFGAAVAAGVDHADSLLRRGPRGDETAEQWLWLLHDDCAPDPEALAHLLDTATSDPRIAAVGGRLRAWPRGRRLLEVGVSITGTGHRETGLEPGEYDQGQYDERRDVLAVSTAGMLVRRRRWADLGGFDPRLPLFRDDVDFGWRAARAGYRIVLAPGAVIFHAEAASRGVRDVPAAGCPPRQADRHAAVLTVVANCRAWAVPFVYVRLLLGSVVRSLGYLLGKRPRLAGQELAGAAGVLGRPWRIASARSWRRRLRVGESRSVRHLMPPWWTPYAHGLAVLLDGTTEGVRYARSQLATSREPSRPSNVLRRHPLAVIVAGLSIAGLVATRGLWGTGFLQGGGLWPAPGGAADLWRLAVQGHHDVGMGSDVVAAPYVELLAVPATLLLGKVWLVVDLVMLLAPPLAAVGAWVASGRLVRSVATRCWLTVSYALLPVVTGAVTTGHLGTVVVVLVLPWIVFSGRRILDLSAPGRWQSAWATGLTLAIACAFAPICWPMAAVLSACAAGWLVWRRQPARAAQWLLVLALPLVLLAPWSARVLSSPSLLLTEAGPIDAPGVGLDASPWQLGFLRIGAAGQAPWWLTAGVTVVAVLALARGEVWARVAAGWLVAATGLVTAAILAGQVVVLPLGGGQAHSWLGVPVVVAGAGLLAAGAFAADGVTASLGTGSFGWRQPVAVAAVVLGLAAPILAVVWWVAVNPHGDLRRGSATPVPSYMADAMSSTGAKVLTLTSKAGVVRYAVLAGDGERLGDDSVLPNAAAPRLTELAGNLLSTGGAADVQALNDLGITYVVLPAPASAAAVSSLDALPGLVRSSTDPRVLTGWQIGSASAPAAEGSDESRLAQVVGVAILWVVVLVLAAPGIGSRSAGPAAPEEVA